MVNSKSWYYHNNADTHWNSDSYNHKYEKGQKERHDFLRMWLSELCDAWNVHRHWRFKRKHFNYK